MKEMLGMLTDTHLAKGNEEQVVDIIKQSIDNVFEKGLDRLYFLGDWFDSRKYQSYSTLKATIQILNYAEEKGICIYAIPGNHDKPNYESEESYLDVFEKYPSLILIRDYECFAHEDSEGRSVGVHMIPFFDEKTTYSRYLEMALDQCGEYDKNILLTHIAVNGVRNNDGSKMEDVVSPKLISRSFDLTCIGHYHDYQELEDGSIVYIGASHQHNFGEDKRKGVTFIQKDLSLTQERLNTKEFNLIKVDLSTHTEEEVKEISDKYKDSKDNVRIKFTGTKEALAAIDKKKYSKLGIGVVKEADEVDVDISYADVVDFKAFNPNTIIEEWGEFAKKKGISDEHAEKGLERLTRILIKN